MAQMRVFLSYAPDSEAEMLERILYTLALIPTDQTSIPPTLEPDESVDNLLTQGRVLAAQKRWTDALSLFQRAITRDPNNPDAWGEMGRALNGSQRYAEALFAHDSSLALNSQLHGSGKTRAMHLTNWDDARKHWLLSIMRWPLTLTTSMPGTTGAILLTDWDDARKH